MDFEQYGKLESDKPVAGRLWLVAGAIMLVNIFLNQTAILIGMIVVIGVAPVIYSFVLYKKGI